MRSVLRRVDVSLSTPERVGPYRVVRLLGHGGMGTVYEVEDAVGVHVALKLFTGGAKNRDFLEKRFRAEAKLLATLEHPHLVKVRDTGVDESTGDPWFTMDLVLNAVGEPETLEEARRRVGISNEQLLGWYRDLSEELAYLHAHGIVHRDVKLENVLVDGGGHVVGIVLTSIADSVKKEDAADDAQGSVRREFEKLKKQMEQFEKAFDRISGQHDCQERTEKEKAK